MRAAMPAPRLLMRAGGRVIAPVGITPQEMAASVLPLQQFSTPAQRSLEHIATDAPYRKRTELVGDKRRVLLFPTSPSLEDSVAAIRELRQLNISPPPLKLFEDAFPARNPVDIFPAPLPLSSRPTGRRSVAIALDRQRPYQEQMAAGILRGMLLGGDQWYGTRPLAGLVGDGGLYGWARDMGVTTHQRNPASNMRAASHMRMAMEDPAFVRMVRELPWDTPADRALSRRALSEAFPYPAGYGGKAALSDFDAAAAHILGRDIMDAEDWGPMKRTLFSRNLYGDIGGHVGDSHEYAARGIPEKGAFSQQKDRMEWGKQMGSDSENEAMQILSQELADQTGMFPGEQQAARWTGDADLTGVRRSNTKLYGPAMLPSAMHTLEDRIFNMVGVPKTDQDIKRARSLLRNVITGGGLLGSLLTPVAQDPTGDQ
jgi:hypothetical protein